MMLLTENKDQPSDNRVGVKIYFVLSSYRVVVELGESVAIRYTEFNIR